MGGLRIYNLNNSGGVLVRILVYRGVVVYNLRVGYILANRVNSKGTWVCRTNLVKYIRYKASDPIKFRRDKEFIGFFSLV